MTTLTPEEPTGSIRKGGALGRRKGVALGLQLVELREERGGLVENLARGDAPIRRRVLIGPVVDGHDSSSGAGVDSPMVRRQANTVTLTPATLLGLRLAGRRPRLVPIDRVECIVVRDSVVAQTR